MEEKAESLSSSTDEDWNLDDIFSESEGESDVPLADAAKPDGFTILFEFAQIENLQKFKALQGWKMRQINNYAIKSTGVKMRVYNCSRTQECKFE